MTALRQRMLEDMRVRNLSPHTQSSYVLQVSLFARHFGRSPEELGPEEIRAWQVHLTDDRKLSPASIAVAVSALRFLYKVTLRKAWIFEEVLPAPKQPQQAARRPQPLGGRAVPRLRRRHQAPRHPDHLLRRRPAHFRGRPPHGRRHRQPAHGDPRRPGQGPQGPLRHALAQPAGDAARLLADRACPGVAVPGRPARTADHPRRRRQRLPQGAPAVRPRQAGHPAFAAPRLRGPSAGSRHRRAHHPAAARPSQPGDHGPVPAHRHQHGLRDDQPARPAAPPGPDRSRRPPHPRTSERPAMARSGPEVADVFRRYGDAYRRTA